jgi:hypothetical protein
MCEVQGTGPQDDASVESRTRDSSDWPALVPEGEVGYVVTEKGRKAWDLLLDPRYFTPEQKATAEALRNSMTDRDWAMQQICLQLDTTPEACPRGVAPSYIKWVMKDIWETEHSGPPDGFLYQQIYHTEEIFDELLAKGLIQVVKSP